MLINRTGDLKTSEITPEHLYLNRRDFIRAASVAGLGLASTLAFPDPARSEDRWPRGQKGPYDSDEFETVYRPEQMPGQNQSFLQWPYVEGLRCEMDGRETMAAAPPAGLHCGTRRSISLSLAGEG
ncbi:MAG: Protein-methionine-sulfoxide reductase catalytic subunit MsrP, partial [Bacteroidetes bacterium]|nr:Protein-methionine-sulfoxide reductase catalytic subunit MsrP [Bacteroidota bacterium]